MKYILGILIFAAVFAGCTQQPQESPPPATPAQDRFFAALGKKPVVLVVTASWCDRCAEEEPILKELEREYPDVEFFRTEPGSELAENYTVRDLPYFVFFNSKGERVYEITGFQGKDVLEMLIKRAIYGSYMQNGSYSSFEGLSKPVIEQDGDRIAVETTATENLTLWGESVEVALNNLSLRVLEVSPPINSIRDFEVLNISRGDVVRVVAELPANLSAYPTFNVEVKLAVYDEGCCGNYREVVVGGYLTQID